MCKQGSLPAGHREWSAIWQIGLASFFMFAAYMPSANLASTLYNKVGYFANAATYAAQVLVTPFAPGGVRIFGSKTAFALGSVPYVIYVFSNWALAMGIISDAVYIAAAAGVGVGGALLWTGMGVYTNDAARACSLSMGIDHLALLGRFNALPWACVFVAAALSQLACGFLLPKLSAQMVFLALTLVCLCGVVTAWSSPTLTCCQTDEISLPRHAGGLAQLLRTKPAARLFLIMFSVQGFNQGFMFGKLPATAAKVFGNSAGSAAIVMAFNAASDCIGALGLGRFSDKVGFRPTYAVGIACNVFGALLLLLPAHDLGVPITWAVVLLSALLLGCADAAWQTQGSAGIGCVLSDQEDSAFALMTTFKGAGSAVAFLLGPVLEIHRYVAVVLFGISAAAAALSQLPPGKAGTGYLLLDNQEDPSLALMAPFKAAGM